MVAAKVTLPSMETMGRRGAEYRELRKRGASVRDAWNVSKSAHGRWCTLDDSGTVRFLPVPI